jgi:Concanavalin A-like lectin/glucanases superfamily
LRPPGGGSIGHPSHIFIGNDDGPGNQNKWFFALGGGFLNFHINSPTLGPQFFPLAPFSPSINTWYHLAVTRSGSLYTLYINGAAVKSATNTASIPSPSAFLTIGEAENLGFMNGLLDEVTIYNRALTDAEIKSIWAAGSAGKCKGTSGPGPTISSVDPSTGGNAGQVTVSIRGSGFAPSAVVNLVNGPQTLVQGTNTGITPSGTLQTTFDLTGVAASPNLQIQVINPDATSATSPFVVINGGAPQLQLEMVGPATARVGRDADFVVLLENTGTVNAPFATATTSAAFSTGSINLQPMDQFGQPLSPDQLSLGSSPSYLLTLPVPTGQKIPLRFRLPGSDDSNAKGCGPVQTSIQLPGPPPVDLLDLDCNQLRALLAKVIAIGNDLVSKEAMYSNELNVLSLQYEALGCDKSVTPQCFQLASEIADLEAKLRKLDADIKALADYELAVEDVMKIKGCSFDNLPTVAAQDSSATQEVCLVTSWDPNAKTGPAGTGAQGFVSGNLLPYTVFFENLASATAPAQQISVVDPLDPSIDTNSVSLGTLNLGGTDYNLGGGQHASRTVDLRPGVNALLQVQADVDTSKRQITWLMTALDPTTLQLPANPQVGILPPNKNPPAGEGNVTFTASAVKDTPANTVISNQATIVFDVNPAIQTNIVSNTIGPACASDVTSQFTISRSGYRYNNASGRFAQVVTLTNRGADILGPFALTLTGLSSNATLFNQAGTTTCSAHQGSPFAVVDPGSTWTSGQTLTVNLEFVDPSKTGITYTPEVLAGSSNR